MSRFGITTLLIHKATPQFNKHLISKLFTWYIVHDFHNHSIIAKWFRGNLYGYSVYECDTTDGGKTLIYSLYGCSISITPGKIEYRFNYKDYNVDVTILNTGYEDNLSISAHAPYVDTISIGPMQTYRDSPIQDIARMDNLDYTIMPVIIEEIQNKLIKYKIKEFVINLLDLFAFGL